MQQVISQLDHISSTICQTFKHQKKNPIEYNDTMSDFVLKIQYRGGGGGKRAAVMQGYETSLI
jgi:hypothetical protein